MQCKLHCRDYLKSAAFLCAGKANIFSLTVMNKIKCSDEHVPQYSSWKRGMCFNKFEKNDLYNRNVYLLPLTNSEFTKNGRNKTLLALVNYTEHD